MKEIRKVEIVIEHNPAANGLDNPVTFRINVSREDGTSQAFASMHPNTGRALMTAGQELFNLRTVGEINLKAGEIRSRQG